MYAKNTHPALRMDARYNLKEQKRIAPVKGEALATGTGTMLSLYSTFGLQYLYNYWAPSAGAGLQIRRAVDQQHWWSVALYEDLYYFFSRNATTGKRMADGNVFITARYSYSSLLKANGSRLTFSNSAAIGYLVSRKGEWFDKVTFKITFPGVRFGNISIEPEFINLSPSIKLNAHIQ